MISVNNTSPHIRVINTTSNPYVSANVNNPMQGVLRFQNSSLQVFDGNSWITMGMNLTTDVSSEFNEVMAWARDRMQEDREFHNLCQEHPALQDAYEKLQIVKALVKKEKHK
jgi:hypothetical protein